MIVVTRTDGQGASIPIGEVCLHGVGRAAAAVQAAFRGRLRTAHRPLRLASSIGSVKTNRLPRPLSFSTQIRPPCSSTRVSRGESEPRALRGGGARPRLARSCWRISRIWVCRSAVACGITRSASLTLARAPPHTPRDDRLELRPPGAGGAAPVRPPRNVLRRVHDRRCAERLRRRRDRRRACVIDRQGPRSPVARGKIRDFRSGPLVLRGAARRDRCESSVGCEDQGPGARCHPRPSRLSRVRGRVGARPDPDR